MLFPCFPSALHKTRCSLDNCIVSFPCSLISPLFYLSLHINRPLPSANDTLAFFVQIFFFTRSSNTASPLTPCYVHSFIYPSRLCAAQAAASFFTLLHLSFNPLSPSNLHSAWLCLRRLSHVFFLLPSPSFLFSSHSISYHFRLGDGS